MTTRLADARLAIGQSRLIGITARRGLESTDPSQDDLARDYVPLSATTRPNRCLHIAWGSHPKGICHRKLARLPSFGAALS